MSKTNCINCGAAKDTSEIKRPFCGTTYLDLTAIDFTSRDPVVCQFVMPHSKGKVIMSMLARPEMRKIETEVESTTMYDGLGYKPLAYAVNQVNTNIDIAFHVIAHPVSKETYSLKEWRKE